MWVQSLGQEDPLEERMATHSSILARRIPWTEEPGGLQSIGLQIVRHEWSYLSCTSNDGIIFILRQIWRKPRRKVDGSWESWLRKKESSLLRLQLQSSLLTWCSRPHKTAWLLYSAPTIPRHILLCPAQVFQGPPSPHVCTPCLCSEWLPGRHAPFTLRPPCSPVGLLPSPQPTALSVVTSAPQRQFFPSNPHSIYCHAAFGISLCPAIFDIWYVQIVSLWLNCRLLERRNLIPIFHHIIPQRVWHKWFCVMNLRASFSI